MASAEKKRLRLCSVQDFKCMSIHLSPQQQKALDITHSGLTDLQATSSAASSLRRSSFPSEYRYSMAMFFPSTYPSSRSPCLNASMRVTLAEGRHRLDIRSAGPSSAAAPRLSLQEQATPVQQALMAPQPSSLRTSFRALCITRIAIKESVIYTAEGDRGSSSRKTRISVKLNWMARKICSMENTVQSWHRRVAI